MILYWFDIHMYFSVTYYYTPSMFSIKLINFTFIKEIFGYFVNYSKYISRNLNDGAKSSLIALPRPLKRSLALDCPCCAQSTLRTTKQWFHVQKHRCHVIGMNNKRPMGHVTHLSNKSHDKKSALWSHTKYLNNVVKQIMYKKKKNSKFS